MLNRKTKCKNQSGFTLIELVAAMIIMALLASGVALGINKMVERARQRATISQVANFGSAVSTFHLECGFYPTSMQDLISAPSSGKPCKGYPVGGFLEKKEIPADPWGNPYNFTSPGIHNPESYDLWSNGPDGEEGSSDDITNWTAEKSDGDGK